MTSASLRKRLCNLCFYTCTTLLCVTLGLLLFRFALVPLLIAFDDSWDTYFYDLALYGPFPRESYRSFPLNSPTTRVLTWSDTCDRENDAGALVLTSVHGSGVDHRGPVIMDLAGELVWLNASFGDQVFNLQMQTWNGSDYLTFWAGENQLGRFYMLDNRYNVVKNISTYGRESVGDLHEFKITADDTALILIYNHTHVDLSNTNIDYESDFIADGIIQELDIETGELLFQWRISDHIGPNDSDYFKKTPTDVSEHHWQRAGGAHREREPLDYFHLNSLDKDSNGNYLLSSRFTNQVLCISPDGEILWAFGGLSEDFEDLSSGTATNFQFQHDARWIDEERGLMSLFDNGFMIDYANNADYSRGMVVKLDLSQPSDKTVSLVHSYTSTNRLRSIAQGSSQFIPFYNTTSDEPQVFIGWGTAAAFSLHDYSTEEVLCETHIAPALFYEVGYVKTYRARLAHGWSATPENWDPHAVLEGGKIYVSWNGATRVEYWRVQGIRASGHDVNGNVRPFVQVGDVPRTGFETAIELSEITKGERYAAYRVTALDGNDHTLRHSNVVDASNDGHSIFFWLLVLGAAAAIVVCLFLFVRRRGWISMEMIMGMWTKIKSASGLGNKSAVYTKLDTEENYQVH